MMSDDENRVMAMIGPCEVCGKPASDMCDCCHGCANLRRQLAEAQQDALELRAWRAVARWMTEGPQRFVSYRDGRLQSARWSTSTGSPVREYYDAATIIDLADAIAPGWRE